MLAAQIAHDISLLPKEEMTVEEIQDVVESHLMNSPRQEVAQEYIRYRNKRNLARKAKTNEIFQTIIDAQVNDITRENANMNADTPAGMMMKFASSPRRPPRATWTSAFSQTPSVRQLQVTTSTSTIKITIPQSPSPASSIPWM